ncbi:hypothetical protein Goshw_004002 [Gossypium schwendimanii]|uniref:Uncharacterized protein n=1 Tax=Gossypium schwendimanii TaxID=34291 RepID=A0A7J9MLZ1_GOSSC|nr:hypothetical protein [Gossypium schwendimanii]
MLDSRWFSIHRLQEKINTGWRLRNRITVMGKESWSNRAHVPKLHNGQYEGLNEQMDRTGKRYNVGISMDLEGVHFINKIRAYERRPEKRNTVVQFFNQEDDWDQAFIPVMEEPIQVMYGDPDFDPSDVSSRIDLLDMEESGRQKRGH